jgi:RNA polymerase sigma factor (sigma-70 family)
MRAWLVGIALRKIVDLQRRRPSRERLDAVARELAVRMVREALPGEWIEREEVRAVVNEALARLPAPTATLLVRKYLQGASVAEIATELQLTEKAVESQLTRARLAFHEVIQRFGDPDLEIGR